jgi:hypothetical protein
VLDDAAALVEEAVTDGVVQKVASHALVPHDKIPNLTLETDEVLDDLSFLLEAAGKLVIHKSQNALLVTARLVCLRSRRLGRRL